MKKIDWTNKNDVISAIKVNPSYFEYVSDELKEDHDVCLCAVKYDGMNLEYVKNQTDVIWAIRNLRWDFTLD